LTVTETSGFVEYHYSKQVSKRSIRTAMLVTGHMEVDSTFVGFNSLSYLHV